jgi:hypothetical protein
LDSIFKSPSNSLITQTTAAEGKSEGNAEGASDGISDGASDGIELGASDGTILGESDGRSLGASEGKELGESDGTSLGASLVCRYRPLRRGPALVSAASSNAKQRETSENFIVPIVVERYSLYV